MAPSVDFPPEVGRALVALAWQTIAGRLGLDLPPARRPDPRRLQDPAARERQGVFVTLTIAGRLRGCIGTLSPEEPLVEGVARQAVNAAFNDHRFPPVSSEEFPRLEVEVSVLSEPQALPYAEARELASRLRPGVDGVIIRSGRHSATFLPQVWDQLPRPEDFLAHLCLKAGLSATAWRDSPLAAFTYQVRHFSGHLG